MKELKDLIKECKDGVTELTDLEKTEAKLRAELKERLTKNARLFQSMTSGYYDLIETLVDITQCSISARDIGVHILDMGDGISLKIEASDYAQKILFSLRKENVGHIDYVNYKYPSNFANSALEFWAYAFGSEDTISKAVKCFEEYVADVLNVYLEKVISKDISTFRTKIENLKSALSDSHVMEEKEDGTVEIRLGGKTYIGTLKED